MRHDPLRVEENWRSHAEVGGYATPERYNQYIDYLYININLDEINILIKYQTINTQTYNLHIHHVVSFCYSGLGTRSGQLGMMKS